MHDKQLREDLRLLATKRIAFGHQSVGANLLEGLQDLAEANPDIPLTMVHAAESTALPAACIAERAVGSNADPESKCRGFEQMLGWMPSGGVDLALMKFCYIDITALTDIHSILSMYLSMVDSLKRLHPCTAVVHVTVPLTSRSPWWKRIAKRLLGLGDSSREDNMRRNEFNRLLLRTFAGEPVFDLAARESTHENGTRESFDEGGEAYLALAGEFTDDGGHLNRRGRMIAAREMLRVLAETLRSRDNPGAREADRTSHR